MRTRTSSTGKRNKQPSGDAGFTLLELLLVITIVALVSGLSLGLFDLGEDDGLRAANTVLAFAASARSQARLDKEPVVLILTEHAVRLSGGGKAREQDFPWGVSLLSIETASGKSGAGELVFQPRGITRAAVVSLRHKDAVCSVYIPSIGSGKVFTEERTLDRILKEP